MMLSIGSAPAAERPVLVPIDREFSLLDVMPDLQAYHLAVGDALLRDAGTHSWEAVVLPSFQREWAVWVEKNEAGGGQKIVCTVMETQLWGRMQGALEGWSGPRYQEAVLATLQALDKGIRRSTVPISEETAAALEKLWSTMLSQARHPPEWPACFDGTGYFLFESSGGARTRGGWGHCPQAGTVPAAALAILEQLRSAATDSTSGTWEGEAELAEEVARLGRVLE